MRQMIYIGVLLLSSHLLSGCISVEIPIGDAIRSTKDWINEERNRDKKQHQPVSEQTTSQ